jgi:hypothetical protein
MKLSIPAAGVLTGIKMFHWKIKMSASSLATIRGLEQNK